MEQLIAGVRLFFEHEQRSLLAVFAVRGIVVVFVIIVLCRAR
jgi:hypothetical protein